jgi:hypothetical protein
LDRDRFAREVAEEVGTEEEKGRLVVDIVGESAGESVCSIVERGSGTEVERGGRGMLEKKGEAEAEFVRLARGVMSP